MSEEDKTISTKKVRSLQLDDEVVVGVQAGVRDLQISTGGQAGEELAKITVDGVEHSVRAPLLDEKTVVQWTQNSSMFGENEADKKVLGVLHVDGEPIDVYFPVNLQYFDNVQTKYQTYDELQSAISDFVPSGVLETTYATQDSLVNVRKDVTEQADAAAKVAETVKELGVQLSACLTKADAEAAYAKLAEVSALATVAELNQLEADHTADIAAVTTRLNAIPNYSEQLNSLNATLENLRQIVSGLQAGGTGSGTVVQPDWKPLKGNTYDVDEADLATLMDVVLRALGANGGSDGPLQGQTVDVEGKDLSELMKLVLENLGATVE